jgi:phage-related minor tail protein
MSFVKSLWAIVMNPIGLIIAAIVGALVALYKAFTSTDSGAKKLAQVMEVVSAVIDVVRQRIASFAKGLIEVFKGNWS